jgi:beta-mannosidase
MARLNKSRFEENKMFLKAWKFREFNSGEGIAEKVFLPDYDDRDWLNIDIPGDVHDALIQHGVIPDPFYDRNESLCRWMEDKTWWFRTIFDFPVQELKKTERLLLNCYGLDTFATLYLNGEEIGKSKNMFLLFSADIKKRIQTVENNCLAIRFDPPEKHINSKLGWESWGRNVERIHFRKAQFSYGWDWGPRLPGIGIWRPVELWQQKKAVIRDFHFRTVEWRPTSGVALISVTTEIDSFRDDQSLELQIALRDKQNRIVVGERQSMRTKAGVSQQEFFLQVESPNLWWTHDLGTPYLYTLSIQLFGDDLLDSNACSVGIRTLELDQTPDPDEPGTRFFRFKLNGVSLFAKGANWIPSDSLVGRLRDPHYETLLSDAKNANMNMLRVWGGGIYEHDWFYCYCDRFGILVWQDFMFACAMYPEEPPDFVKSVEKEAVYQIRRLRNHASLALWCGNNENQWIHERTFWRQSTKVPGSRYYDHILPDAVAEHDGKTPYWPGSPYGGNDYNSAEDGDRHNWQVWHGDFPRRFGEEPKKDISPQGVNFHHYETDMGRFISEFGMHASPSLDTLKRCIPEDQLFFHSPSMDHHNKDFPKNKGDNLMRAITGLPQDLSEYIDYSMITQAEGLKLAIEHYRRRKPHCAGALFWQFNDCWPSLSWSVVDYYGGKKAGYYFTKRAFAPVLASFRIDDDVEVWLSNDTLSPCRDRIAISLMSFDGRREFFHEQDVHIPANSSQLVFEFAQPQVDKGNHYLLVESVTSGFSANRRFLLDIKDLDIGPSDLEVQFKPIDSRMAEAEIIAEKFVYFVHFQYPEPQVVFSDNYVDLHPGQMRRIRIFHPQALETDRISVKKY